MITKLTLSNYRSLGNKVVVELAPFTALVGRNGAGKSSILDALRFVTDSLTIGLAAAVSARHIRAIRRWSSGYPHRLAISLDLELSSGPARYSFELAGDGKRAFRVKSEEAAVTVEGVPLSFAVNEGIWTHGPADLHPPTSSDSFALRLLGGDRRFRPLVEALQTLTVYSISPDFMKQPQRLETVRPLDRQGVNWISILIDQPETSWKPELLTLLNRLTGDIEDLRFQEAGEYSFAEFRHLSETRLPKWLSADQESDGTLRVAGIGAALLQEPPPSLIAIEEPELTVHPGALPLLYDYLKQAARRTQVIVTTHSPDFLDLLSTDEIRVVTRTEAGSLAGPICSEQRSTVRAGLLTLGEVQRGEGLIAHVPSA